MVAVARRKEEKRRRAFYSSDFVTPVGQGQKGLVDWPEMAGHGRKI
jgi:hypothetical protein